VVETTPKDDRRPDGCEATRREATTNACDASGATVVVPAHPERIVSLVPSVTETLFALGLGERVVGVTEWCIHPRDAVARLPKVRGTKNPDVDAIRRLAPDLVVANLEENREIDVRRLRESGLTVWVDFPRTVHEAISQVRWLASLGASDERTSQVLGPIEEALRRAQQRTLDRPVRGFIATWKDPWMTLSRDTYAHDLLALVGIDNVFAGAERRYPRVSLADVAARDPEIVLLPDEPYRFTSDDGRELAESALASTSAARNRRIHVIDGTLPFWHGPRIARAIETLAALRALDA
jgi:ABC-type Fe3+-hydroxamate transport system substrate-binding protein